MNSVISIPVPDDLHIAVDRIKDYLKPGRIVFLNGPLGAGKTTLVRAVMERLGSEDLVASPSFSLINVYQTPGFPVAHFDLYRLEGKEDLEAIGSADFLDGQYLIFVEWPDKGAGFFPEPDVMIEITISAEADDRRMTVVERQDG